MFSTLIYFAFHNRFNPAAHKRLILIAMLAILDAAFDRWPISAAWWGNRVTPLLCTYPLLLLLMGYDWWSTRKIQRVTLWASGFLVVAQQGRDLIGHTAAWQSFATCIRTHGLSTKAQTNWRSLTSRFYFCEFLGREFSTSHACFRQLAAFSAM
jgi:hypothetical protein